MFKRIKLLLELPMLFFKLAVHLLECRYLTFRFRQMRVQQRSLFLRHDEVFLRERKLMVGLEQLKAELLKSKVQPFPQDC